MIYVECYADKILIGSLAVSEEHIEHAGNIGKVCNRLTKNKISKGLVDEDPGKTRPSYVAKLKLLKRQNDIELRYDKKNQNYLVILCPRLEEWILKAIKETKEISISDYGLPDRADELHKTLSISRGSPEKFRKLLKAAKSKSKMLKTLEKFIKSK